MSGLPTVISFYCGDRYYYEAAERLRGDCIRLGLPHDIEEIDVPEDQDWSQICREKIGFYKRKLDQHDRPILWVDGDCRLLRAPDMLDGCKFDMAGFAQRFRYIRDYDPYDTVRFWVPGVLFFNNNENGRAFIELMNEVEQGTDERITDDFCLHEAWTTFDRPMNVGFFSPKTVVKTMPQATPHTVWVYGASGNVADFKGTVLQHTGRDLLSNPRVRSRIVELHDTPQVRAAVLNECATDMLKSGDRDTALKVLRKSTQLDPDDVAWVKRYAETLRIAGRPQEAFDALASFLDRQPDAGEARQILIKLAMVERELELARQHVTRLANHEDEKWRNYAKSANFDLSLEERAAERGTPLSKRTPLWWMKTPYPGNFGDILNPYIIEKVTGEPPRFVSKAKAMFAIGSVIKFAQKDTRVWGTGTARSDDELASDAQYHAVRGPLTRKLVLSNGGSCPEVYGDPGLLLPRFYFPEDVTKNYKVGLIRHLKNQDAAIQLSEAVRDISIIRVGYDEIEQFVDEILECEVILSTSLHGIITAHAYGIPARWCTFGNQPDAIPGDGTKFEDYFRSVGLRVQKPLDLSDFPVIDESLASRVDREVDLQFDADRLLEAFPH